MHEGEFIEGRQFTPEQPAPDGEGWILEPIGHGADNPLRVHPAYLVDAESRLVWSLYNEYQGAGFAAGALPEPGGTLGQACCTMASFALCAHFVKAFKPE